jgi:hypothetical protein
MDDAIRRNERYVHFTHMRAFSTQQRMSIWKYTFAWKSWWCGAHVARSGSLLDAACDAICDGHMQRSAATRHVCSKGVIRTYLFWLGGGTCTTASVETLRGKSSRALLNYPHYAVPLHFRWLRNAVSIHLSSSEKILECHAHVSERSQRSLAEGNCCLWSVIVMAVRNVRVPLRVRHVVRHTVRSRPSPPHS